MSVLLLMKLDCNNVELFTSSLPHENIAGSAATFDDPCDVNEASHIASLAACCGNLIKRETNCAGEIASPPFHSLLLVQVGMTGE